MSNNFDSFSSLPEQLQLEALREGEVRIQAQLQIATAADQRALTWGGLLIAAATGALGGGLALIGKSDPDYGLGFLAVVFSIFMMLSAWVALQTVRPSQFYLPGNRPANWLPEKWACVGSDRRKNLYARMEQAEQLSRHIAENAENAEKRAMQMNKSFQIARWTVLASGALLFSVILDRLFQPDWNTLFRSVSRCFCGQA